MKRTLAQSRAVAALGALLACCPRISALNPSLDISQYAHRAWTVRDGFFKGAVQAIAQTPDGYLWLGTEFGLLRFDGVRWVPWSPPAGQTLPSSVISKLLVTRDGRLWIGTFAGLATWKDGRVTQYPEFAGQLISALFEDRQGTTWVGTLVNPTGRLCAFRDDSIRCYGSDGSFGRGILSLYEYKDSLWVGALTGLWRWKPESPKHYPLPGPVTEPRALIEGANGALLIAMPGELLQFVDGKTEPYPLASVGQFSPERLLRDREGGLWIETSGKGLLHLHGGKTDRFASGDGLSGDFGGDLFEDREGNIWAATIGGLDRFRDYAVSTISVKQGPSNRLPAAVLAAKDGSVWLGTNDGLVRWNNGHIASYRTRDGLPSDAITSLAEDDHQGRIWASTLKGSAYFEDGKFVSAHGVPGGLVESIVEERAGNIWISHQQEGLFHWRNDRLIEKIPWARLGLKENAPRLVPDPNGGLWLGFYNGGLAYFKDGQVRASFGLTDGLGKGYVSQLRFDREGALWAATEGGLSRIKNGRIATLSRKNGLPCDAVQWSMDDDNQAVWFATTCGLLHVARSDLDAWAADSNHRVNTAVFDSSDGVRSQGSAIGYSPVVSKATDGKLWFVTYDGVGVIDARHLSVNRLPPPVYIEQITFDGKTSDAHSKMRLPALVRDVSIEYTALSFAAPEKIRFRYKLEGQDKDWREVVNQRQVHYSNLAPRKYRFRVAAANNSGVWNEAGDTLEFSIAPAYYQTIWFQSACGIAFLALLWGFYRYRLYQVAREFNVRLEERVSERTRLARDLHDTLLQSFHGLMLHFQAVNKLLPEGRAKKQQEIALELAHQVFSESRSTVYDLRSSAITTNELSEALNAVGKELSKEDGAEFGLVVEGPPRGLHPIVRDELYRISREALRNAFKHARARHIEAEINYGDRVFRMRIRDDGEGIPAAILEQGRPGHYGLRGMRERARQVGADLNIWSRAGSGTEIDLNVAGSIAYGTSPRRSRLRIFGNKGHET